MADTQIKDVPESEETQEERQPLKLDVKISSPSACQRHITVKIPHEDVERYFDQAFGELMPDAQVPGFRAGRAPRKLVEHRFRKDVKDQVKSSLLMDAMAQISEDHKLAAISEPDLNLAAVEIPDEGPMTFEFDIEVRPEFDLPQWKGLTIERPGREFTQKDVDQQMQRLLARRGKLVPHDGKAEMGDYISVNITFKDGDEVISQLRGAGSLHPAHAQLPRRQHRKVRQADGGREGGRHPRGQGQDLRRRTERKPARQDDYRRVRSAGSEEARTARIDAGVFGRAGRDEIGGGTARCVEG